MSVENPKALEPSEGFESRWLSASVYEMYPRSFQDTTGSGEGDLEGARSRLGYLQDLGVDAIWLTPFYPSPMNDGGYDVSDYRDVDERYGSLEDFKNFLAQAHEQGMMVMIDLVANHTSSEHSWFIASSDPEHPEHEKYKDYYIWSNGIESGDSMKPPNNWSSVFSENQLARRRKGELVVPDDENTPPVSAWMWSDKRGQYYLRSFDETQPDLNWDNPEVEREIFEVMRYWIELGVDGFRVDAVNYIGKNPEFTNEEINPDYVEGIDNPYDVYRRHNSAGFPNTFYPRLRRITDVLYEYPDRDLKLVFEAYMDPDSLAYISAIDPKVTAFNFVGLDDGVINASDYQKFLDEYNMGLPGDDKGNHVMGNHDKPRPVSRLGEDMARMMAVLHFMLPGMVFTYQGEEGGFKDVDIPYERVKDVMYLGKRDSVRTPMLWDNTKNAGFSDADEEDLWLPIDPDYKNLNLEDQYLDPQSFLNLYRNLHSLRNGHNALKHGAYVPLVASSKCVVAFARRVGSEEVILIANFSETEVRFSLENTIGKVGKTILSSLTTEFDGSERQELRNEVVLLPKEARVLFSTKSS